MKSQYGIRLVETQMQYNTFEDDYRHFYRVVSGRPFSVSNLDFEFYADAKHYYDRLIEEGRCNYVKFYKCIENHTLIEEKQNGVI